MGLHHRKLIPEICQSICHVEEEPCSSDCKVCLKICLTNPYSYYSPPPPPTPFSLDEHEHHEKHHKISTYLILSLALLVAAFFVVCFHAIYTRFFSRRRRRVSSSRQQTQETRDDFVDEEHGPVVVEDHPIWYIRTTGLHESIISAITVCKYKKGEGLIEGTECSVCLSEFQEEENLRFLPKCHHAFHLPCIDTWLTSHTNCPMCRAPIVTNPARIPSMDPNVFYPSSLENTQLELVENSDPAPQLRNRAEEEGQLEVEDETRICETESQVADVVVNTRPRRSVSLDSSSVANINLALATVLLGDVNEGIVSKRVTGSENLPTTSRGSSSFRARSLQCVPTSMKRSRSYNGKYLLSSWYSRSQRKPNAPLRSF